MMKEWKIEHGMSEENVDSESRLRARLIQLSGNQDPSLLLVHKSGDHLFLAFRGSFAVVIFRPITSNRPHLSASVDENFKPVSETDYVEFMVGGTATPIPKDRCIPKESAVRIALYYFEHRSLPSFVKWVED